MTYPIELVEVEKGFSLYQPKADQVRPTYERLLSDNQNTVFPFWAKVWPSAKAMSLFLQSNQGIVKGKSVLEIGAGIGIPSLIMAKQAESMIISDHNLDAVELLKENIAHLQLHHVEALCLDWNNFPDYIKAETVLLSDVNYDPIQFDSLLKLINRFLEDGATIILSTPQRIMAKPFAEALESFRIESHLLSIEEHEVWVDISVFVICQ